MILTIGGDGHGQAKRQTKTHRTPAKVHPRGLFRQHFPIRRGLLLP
nr:MAG TPA: hypothetical protein [Caudoviricetes sp.]